MPVLRRVLDAVKLIIPEDQRNPQLQRRAFSLVWEGLLLFCVYVPLI